jgi:hypothetical protein
MNLASMCPSVDLFNICFKTEEEKIIMEGRLRKAEFTAARIVEECERRYY